MQICWVRNMVDSSLTSEILRNLMQYQKRPPKDFILKTIIRHETAFSTFLEENNTLVRYIITVLSQILKKSEGEIYKIVKQPISFINKAKRYSK